MERLYGLVFAAKRMVKGAATLTSFVLRVRQVYDGISLTV